MTEETKHSKLGASGAERWMNCSGSTALIQALELPQTDEPDYRREGVAGHEAAADCLARDIDAFEIIGEKYYDTVITADMGEAIQSYLDRVRPSIDRGRFHGEQFFIEAKLAAPDIHEQMFGTVDFGALTKPTETWTGPFNASEGFLDVTDLKMGQGITVEATDNPQMKYYAFMLIHTHFKELDDEFPVRLSIVQPRAFHPEGPIREWWCTVGDIRRWVVTDLLPAMHSTDAELQAGPWCRFCPAKLVCPMLTGLFRAAANTDPRSIIDASDKALGLSYDKLDGVKFYVKALEEEVFRRLQLGRELPGAKLVNKQAKRVFKTTVTQQVEGKDVEVDIVTYCQSAFGAKAFTTPELKSPAEMEKMDSPNAKRFVKEYAYMPISGLTVARMDDKRHAVKMTKASESLDADTLKILTNGD